MEQAPRPGSTRTRGQNTLFAPNGKTVVFTRVSDAGDNREFWSVEPRGGNLHKLPAVPDWYTDAKDSPFFDDLDDESDVARLVPADSSPASDPLTYRAPNGSVELTLKVRPGGDEDSDSMNLPGHGKLYEMHNLKTDETTILGTLPGFEGLVQVLALERDKDQRFLLAPPLHVAFFGLHLGSTDGNTVFALDLDGKRLVRLSPNWAAPYPLPGEPAFLTWTENRYVRLGDGTRTANCSYVERWDAKLRAVRYAKEKAAGIYYGASTYRSAKNPAVIYLKSSEP